MPRDDLYLFEMVQASDHVQQFLGDVGIPEWTVSELLGSAVLQKLTVIGEAARAVSPVLKSRYTDISVVARQVLGVLTAEFPDVARQYSQWS